MSYNNGLSKKYQQMLEDFLNREEWFYEAT
jgi:hypothetical protein